MFLSQALYLVPLMNLATAPQNEHGGQTEIVRNVEVSCFCTDYSQIPLGFLFRRTTLLLAPGLPTGLAPKNILGFLLHTI